MSLTKIGGAVGDIKKIGVVNSVADLAGLVGKEDGQQVSVKGYHTGSDVGGGVFYWDSSRTAENDSGTVFDGWVRILDGYVTPEMFGAKGDGTTDDGQGMAGCFFSGYDVIGQGCIYESSIPLSITAASQTVDMRGGGIRFTDTDPLTSLAISGDRSELKGSVITSTNRKDYLLNLDGERSAAINCDVFFPTAPNRYPLNDNDIIYGKAGVRLIGSKAKLIDSNIYNNDGAGVAVGEGGLVVNCSIYSNGGMGVHCTNAASQRARVINNRIYNNDGIGVLAANNGCVLEFSHNEIYGNGSHGAYLRCHSNEIHNNYFYDNYKNGLKVRDCKGVLVRKNTLYNNMQSGEAGSDLAYQINDFGIEGLIIVDNEIPTTSTASSSIGPNWVGPSLVCNGLVIARNKAKAITFAGEGDCSDNYDCELLYVGLSTSAAPSVQSGIKCENNKAVLLFVSNRVTASDFFGNVVDRIETTPTGGRTTNKVNGNTFKNQTVQLQRRFFDEFCGNKVNVSGLSAVVFVNAGTGLNSNQKIMHNDFTGMTTHRVIEAFLASLSGDNCDISFNSGDISSGDLFRLYGNKNSVNFNRNKSTGGTAFVDCTNSYLIGNIPIATQGGTASGNILL
jgi:hypothetical protein